MSKDANHQARPTPQGVKILDEDLLFFPPFSLKAELLMVKIPGILEKNEGSTVLNIQEDSPLFDLIRICFRTPEFEEIDPLDYSRSAVTEMMNLLLNWIKSAKEDS